MAEKSSKRRIPGVGEIIRNLDYYLAVVCMLFVTVYCFINVVCRLTVEKTSASLEELNIIVFIWFLYAAIAYCVRTDTHIRIEFLDVYVSGKAAQILKILADIICLVFSAYIAYAGWQLVIFNTKFLARTSILQIPVFIPYAVIFLSFLSITVFLLRNIVIKIKDLSATDCNNGGH